MKLRILSLFAIFLTACSSSVKMKDLQSLPPQEIVFAVPSNIDETLKLAINKFKDSVYNISESSINVKLIETDNPLLQLGNSAHISLVEDADIIENTPKLQFLRLPFLFDSSDEYFAFLNGREENSPISKIVASKYEADILGIYLDKTKYILSNQSLGEDLNLTKSIGILQNEISKDLYSILGFTIQPIDTNQNLTQLYKSLSIDSIEIDTNMKISDSIMSSTASIGLTEHGYSSYFLLMSNKINLNTKTKLTLKQAYAETIYQYTLKRKAKWDDFYINLLNRKKLQVYTIGDFSPARKSATINLLTHRKELGIDDEIWKELDDMVIIT